MSHLPFTHPTFRRSAGLRFLSLLVLFILTMITASCDSDKKEKEYLKEYTDEEIEAMFEEITPRDEDFKFIAPATWSSNLAAEAQIISTASEQDITEVKKIIDGNPASTWTCQGKPGGEIVVIDLGKIAMFNRLVLFNRCTDQRGTGGGNNALKKFALFVSDDNIPQNYKSLGTFNIEGPRAVCFKKKGGGQVCAFIDLTEPGVIQLDKPQARFLKFFLEEAFWGESAKEEWKSSLALSEIMIFQAPQDDT